MWATRALRDHLVKGYSPNEHRLKQRGILEMEQTVHLLGHTLRSHNLVTDEGKALLDVVGRYARSWQLLLQYDENRLPTGPARPTKKMARLTPIQARKLIIKLKTTLEGKGEASSLFGAERAEGLDGVLGSIEQTFDGEPLSPSVETELRTCCTSSSKTIRSPTATSVSAACCSCTTLTKTSDWLAPTDARNDRSMVALALLIAESDPPQKELTVNLILNLLDDAE